MALSACVEKARSPTDEDLRATLGRAFAPWCRLLALVSTRIGPVTEVWGFTSASTGWGLRVRRKDRVILYMTPQRNKFLVSFALGEKAVAAVQATRMPAAILSAVASAPKYAEGRGVRIEVTNNRPVAALAALAEIKSQH